MGNTFSGGNRYRFLQEKQPLSEAEFQFLLKHAEKLHHLDLSNRCLRSIPSIVYTQVWMRSLDLSDNPIKRISSKIRHLHLVSLKLSNTKIKTLPNEICSLPLVLLDLEGSRIESLPDNFSQLNSTLRHLNIRATQLHVDGKDLHPIIYNLTNLTTLKLESCPSAYKNTNLAKIGKKIEKIKILEIIHCGLANIHIRILESKKLAVLRVPHNKIGTLDPRIGQYCKVLRELILDDNNLTALPPELANVTTLHRIHANDNNIKEIPPVLFTKLLKLTDLQLDRNAISSIPPEISHMRSLKTLYLSEQRKFKSRQGTNTPTSFDERPLKSMPDLSSLSHLHRLRLDSNAISSIPDLPPSLKVLDICHNCISNWNISCLSTLCNLNTFCILENQDLEQSNNHDLIPTTLLTHPCHTILSYFKLLAKSPLQAQKFVKEQISEEYGTAGAQSTESTSKSTTVLTVSSIADLLRNGDTGDTAYPHNIESDSDSDDDTRIPTRSLIVGSPATATILSAIIPDADVPDAEAEGKGKGEAHDGIPGAIVSQNKGSDTGDANDNNQQSVSPLAFRTFSELIESSDDDDDDDSPRINDNNEKRNHQDPQRASSPRKLETAILHNRHDERHRLSTAHGRLPHVNPPILTINALDPSFRLGQNRSHKNGILASDSLSLCVESVQSPFFSVYDTPLESGEESPASPFSEHPMKSQHFIESVKSIPFLVNKLHSKPSNNVETVNIQSDAQNSKSNSPHESSQRMDESQTQTQTKPLNKTSSLNSQKFHSIADHPPTSKSKVGKVGTIPKSQSTNGDTPTQKSTTDSRWESKFVLGVEEVEPLPPSPRTQRNLRYRFPKENHRNWMSNDHVYAFVVPTDFLG